jgi:hypothetical protein
MKPPINEEPVLFETQNFPYDEITAVPQFANDKSRAEPRLSSEAAATTTFALLVEVALSLKAATVSNP